jgi:hypothetical protein
MLPSCAALSDFVQFGDETILWTASLILLNHLQRSPEARSELVGSRVLELGSGLGHLGLGLAELGAHVTCTERPQELAALQASLAAWGARASQGKAGQHEPADGVGAGAVPQGHPDPPASNFSGPRAIDGPLHQGLGKRQTVLDAALDMIRAGHKSAAASSSSAAATVSSMVYKVTGDSRSPITSGDGPHIGRGPHGTQSAQGSVSAMGGSKGSFRSSVAGGARAQAAGSCEAVALEWGASGYQRSPLSTQQLAPFDIIVCSELYYKPELFQELLWTLRR